MQRCERSLVRSCSAALSKVDKPVHVGAGDVVVMPAGVPHMFTAVDSSIAYLVIRVDPK